MYKVVRKSEAKIREIADNKTAANYISKDICKEVSLATTKGKNYYEKEIANYNRIYFVLAGEITLQFENQEISLHAGDACFVEKGEMYTMRGTFEAVVINQPAFGA